MDGNAKVRRFFSICIEELPEDTPATRRQAPRTASVIFMMFIPDSNHVEKNVFVHLSSAARQRLCGAVDLARDSIVWQRSAPTKKPHRSGALLLNPNSHPVILSEAKDQCNRRHPHTLNSLRATSAIIGISAATAIRIFSSSIMLSAN